MTIVLIGFMGAGKTTVAKALAQRLGLLALDTDELVQEVAGAPIESLWARDGEAGFRDREEVAVAAAVSTPGCVVATGAGAVTRQPNRAIIQNATEVVYLEAPLDVLWARASAAPAGRPNARDRGTFDALFAERETLYRTLASITIDATIPVEQVVDRLAEQIDA